MPKLQPIRISPIDCWIDGRTPLICHRFDEKIRQMMRDLKAGQNSKLREVCNPEEEYIRATYFLNDGTTYAFPVGLIKKAMTLAADISIGCPKTHVRKSVFFEADEGYLVKLHTPGPKMVEDVVRLKNGAPDLRYRPYFNEWSIHLRGEFNAEVITEDVILNVLDRAGFGSGLGEWRPEKGGEYGRFQVRRTPETKPKATRKKRARSS